MVRVPFQNGDVQSASRSIRPGIKPVLEQPREPRRNDISHRRNDERGHCEHLQNSRRAGRQNPVEQFRIKIHERKYTQPGHERHLGSRGRAQGGLRGKREPRLQAGENVVVRLPLRVAVGDGNQARLFVSLGKKHGVSADDLRTLLAGPIGGDYSPTRLTAQLLGCS